MTAPGNAYDAFAWFYDRYWAAPFQQWQLPALKRLVLESLPPGSAILDLCCGAGHLARELSGSAFQVTGIDSSEGMLAVARQNAPSARFLHRTAEDWSLPHPVDAALCTFDSVNHILEPETVLASFRQIFSALKPGGRLIFDINTSAAYGERWDASAAHVEPDHAFFLRGRFDPVSRVGHTEITMFRLHDSWSRTDVSLRQRPWEVPEISALLTQAGFRLIEHWRASEDLDLAGHYGLGRVYVRAC